MKYIYLIAALFFGITANAQDGNMPDESPAPSPTQTATLPTDYLGNITLNYVRTVIPTQPVTTENNLISLRISNKALEQTVYADGFLRPLQTVTKKPANIYTSDLVQYYNYDANGKVTRNILPFVKADRGNNAAGKFDKLVNTDLRQTYDDLGYSDDDFLYQETIYEQSLRGRVLEQRGAGNMWAGRANGTTIETLQLPSNETLLKWDIAWAHGSVPAVSTNYTSAEIIKTITTDEDDSIQETYTDRDGNVVAVRKDGLLTYYVFDFYGRLRCVIPPKAVGALEGTGNVLNSTILDNLCFRYEYDGRGNQSSIKKPGIGATALRYNFDDELVMSQDANQQANDQWMFYKYDVRGRIIQQGIYSGSDVASDPDPGSQSANGGGPLTFLQYLYHTPVYSTSDYQYSFTGAEFFLHYYFDDYSFINYLNGLSLYTSNELAFVTAVGNATEGYKTVKSDNTQGLLTGVFTAVSDDSKWIGKANYYNERGELIQAITDDLAGRITVTGMGYDFSGNLVKTVLQNSDITIQKKYTYDLYGRLRYISHKAGGANDFRRLAQYEYDEAGRLKIKLLGSMKYQVNYEYNIRNWITGINKQYVNDPEVNMYFGMEISYESGFTTNYLNGRISGIKWRNKGTSNELRSYGYMYDSKQRLEKADYYYDLETETPGTHEWAKELKDFTTENMTYDDNGNMLSMRHMGLDATKSKVVLDDLAYFYPDLSNKLLAVTDEGESTDPAEYDGLGDFRDVTGNSDYAYDANGNLTSDANRNIDQITTSWFNLNKPLETTFTDHSQNKITYVYDALGNLLRKTAVWQPATNLDLMTKTIDYVGEVIYENNEPALVMHEEGRIRITKNPHTNIKTYYYDYFLRDHIQNIRSIISEAPTEGIFDAIDPSTLDPGTISSGSFNGFNDPVGYIATSELINSSWEDALFDRVGETRNERPGVPEPGNDEAAELNASAGSVLGPGKLIKVMAGDLIELGAEAFYYSTSNPTTPLPLNAIVSQVINALTSAAAATGELTNAFTQANLSTTELSMALSYLQDENEADTTQPRAYLNYMIFDESFNILPDESGALQVGQADAWENISVPQFEVHQNGYLYVFTSNKSQVNVSTDNLYIYHWQGRLLEEFHYYPYGLTFDVSSAPNIESSTARYNSQSIERDEFTWNDEQFGLNWYDFMARSYDPQTGRWMQPDPMMQHMSPYLAMSNNPSSFTDPLGLSDQDYIGRHWISGQEVVRVKEKGPHQYYWVRETGHGTWESLHEAPAFLNQLGGERIGAEMDQANYFEAVWSRRIVYSAGVMAETSRRSDETARSNSLHKELNRGTQNGNWTTPAQAGLLAGELARQGKAYQIFGSSAQTSDKALSVGKYIHNGDVYWQGNYSGVTNSMKSSLSTAKFVKATGNTLAILGAGVTLYQAGGDFSNGKYYSGSARIAVGAVAAGAVFIPVVGWGVSLSIGVADAIWGDDFYEWIEK